MAHHPGPYGQGELPMAWRSRNWGDPNPQLASPLYNGRIPPEIRSLIFDFALAETTISHPVDASHDFAVQSGHGPGDDEPEPGPEPPGAPQNQPAQDTPATNADAIEASSVVQALCDHTRLDHDENEDPEDGSPKSGTLGWPWTKLVSADLIRPDYRGHTVIYTGLLRSCRRIYLETRHKPIREKEFKFWTDASPNIFLSLSNYFNRFPAYQALEIRSLHLYATMNWLERHLRPHVEVSAKTSLVGPGYRIRVLDQIEILRITIRRRDWAREGGLNGGLNGPLVINPFANRNDDMSLEMQAASLSCNIAEALGGRCRQYGEPWSWSTAFLSIPKLNRLVMDFETSEDKKAELDTIVEWAKTWRFPVLRRWQLHDLMEVRLQLGPETLRSVRHAYLSTAGKPVHQMSWRGLPEDWGDRCPKCQAPEFEDKDCAYCSKARNLCERNKGPRLLVSTVTWTAEPDILPAPDDGDASPSPREFSPESTPGKAGDEERASEEEKLPAVPMPPSASVPPKWMRREPVGNRFEWLRHYTVQL